MRLFQVTDERLGYVLPVTMIMTGILAGDITPPVKQAL